jgi:hypothetical protein
MDDRTLALLRACVRASFSTALFFLLFLLMMAADWIVLPALLSIITACCSYLASLSIKSIASVVYLFFTIVHPPGQLNAGSADLISVSQKKKSKISHHTTTPSPTHQLRLARF